MLIIFGGLPGVGKTTIAQVLARRLQAVYLRIDTVEQVLKREAQLDGPEGYMVCWAQALENLKLGMTVVADSVNAIQVTREAWQNVAKDASVTFLEVEFVCSDSREHQRRVETRDADIIGHQLPKWQDVKEREYERWHPHLVFDTTKQTPDAIVEEILERIKAEIISKSAIAKQSGRGFKLLPKNASLRHAALAVRKIDECEAFYNMLGMKTELKTQDYVYLSGNGDNISLHRTEDLFASTQRLEHIGFALDSVLSVNALYEEMKSTKITILDSPKTFGIGTHSFSVSDPDGIEVEFTYHPPMWEKHGD